MKSVVNLRIELHTATLLHASGYWVMLSRTSQTTLMRLTCTGTSGHRSPCQRPGPA